MSALLYLLILICFCVIVVKIQKLSRQIQKLSNQINRQANSSLPNPSAPHAEKAAAAAPAAEIKPSAPPDPAPPAREIAVSSPSSNPIEKTPSLPTPPPRIKSASPPPSPRPAPSQLELRTRELLKKFWNWLIVGEEFRLSNIPMEYAVATVWLVRLGIVLLLFGVGFFLKYSHDNNLTPPAVRLAVSAIAAGGILAVAFRYIRTKYRILALGMAGISLVMLYGVVFAGVHLYQLLPVAAAIPMMLFITITGNVLAVKSNAIFLAEIALLGGYATPALLSSGSCNISGLFLYLLLIGCGFLTVAIRKDWKPLTILAFLFNALYYFYFILTIDRSGPVSDELLADCLPMLWGGTLFFLLFSLMPLIYNLSQRVNITLVELLLQLANAGMFLFAVLPWARIFFQSSLPQASAVLPLGMAGYYLLFIKYQTRCGHQDRPLLLTCFTLSALGLALMFPLLLDKDYLTLTWGCEAALLLYLAIKLNSKVLEYLSFLCYAAAAGAAIPLFHNDGVFSADYFQGALSRFFSLGALAGNLLAGWWILMRFGRAKEHSFKVQTAPLPTQIFFALGMLVLTGLLYLELSFLADELYPPAIPFAQVLALLSITAACFELSICRTSNLCRSMGILLLWLTGLHCIFHLLIWVNEAEAETIWFCRLAEALLTAGVLLRIARNDHQKILQMLAGILAGVVWFTYSSFEWTNFIQHYLPDFCRGGLSALWGIYAVLLILGGMWKQQKFMRMCGLCLFGITAGKVLLWDIPQLNTLYRIITLMAVGAAVLAGAWLYLRAEKFFKENTKGKESHDQT